ncbi:MAG: class I SAM-dependent methyltransferase [Bacteriovorax sp.]|jgi:methyltransferase (TIGR00027 family)|nr:class I SAM-dependent methyltransferase [Bacteriovorax sp.]
MIKDVTDTAIWVATYRAEETQRQDALFRDPFALQLIGDQGPDIAKRTQGSRYTAWSVVIRTRIIDEMILQLTKQGVDTVLNLGAGLDTRPYRLDLPTNLRWIEIDFNNIIDLKNEKMKSHIPHCRLERIKLDLSITSVRNDLFKAINKESKSVLILTEGVIPYLSNLEAGSLASALYDNLNFHYWITEYYSPEILEFLRTPKRLKQMENAPFLFYPEDWFAFFKQNGWCQATTKYFGVESKKWGRTPPTPGWLKKNVEFMNEENLKAVHSYLGYTLYHRSSLF